MNQFMAITAKFRSTLPLVKTWIEDLLDVNENNGVSIAKLNFPTIRQIFPPDLLEKSSVVYVKGKVPFPPLSSMGLSELAGMEQMSMGGITYKDTIFINQLHKTESLHFHELVHVIQWERLGIENFLLAYGIGLLQFGYDNSPLEQMAYSLQLTFDTRNVPSNIIDLIQNQTDAIWKEAKQTIGEN